MPSKSSMLERAPHPNASSTQGQMQFVNPRSRPLATSAKQERPPLHRASSAKSASVQLNKDLTEPARAHRSQNHLPKNSIVKHNVRDGKMFHARVTLGYLTGVTAKDCSDARTRNKGPTDGLMVTGYAALEPGVVSSDNFFAPSHPLKLTSDHPTVVWPEPHHNRRAERINKSKRRLYFSALLGTMETGESDVRYSADDLVSIASMAPPAETVVPEMVNIQLGLMRGGHALPLGIATLVVSGGDVIGQRIDLPVRTPTSHDHTDGAAAANAAVTVRKTGLKGFFAKKARLLKSFPNDDRKYSIEPNAVLRVRLDVMSDVGNLSGPALWGDLEDDADSFGSILVVDLTPESTRSDIGRCDESLDGLHESIEVFNNRNGTTIVATPGPQLNGINDEDPSDRIFTFTSADASVDSGHRSHNLGVAFLEGALCGTVQDVEDSSLRQDSSLETSLADHDFDDSTIETSALSRNGTDQWYPALDSTRSESAFRDRSLVIAERSFLSANSTMNDTARDGIKTDESIIAAKNILLKYSTRVGVTIEQLLERSDDESSYSTDLVSTADMSDNNTVQSVKAAKSILIRYANRMGVDIDDLLDRKDSSTCDSDGYDDDDTETSLSSGNPWTVGSRTVDEEWTARSLYSA